MSNDGIEWSGPPCPECGGELDAEPVSTDAKIVVAYSCPAHGAMSVVEPF